MYRACFLFPRQVTLALCEKRGRPPLTRSAVQIWHHQVSFRCEFPENLWTGEREARGVHQADSSLCGYGHCFCSEELRPAIFRRQERDQGDDEGFTEEYPISVVASTRKSGAAREPYLRLVICCGREMSVQREEPYLYYRRDRWTSSEKRGRLYHGRPYGH